MPTGLHSCLYQYSNQKHPTFVLLPPELVPFENAILFNCLKTGASSLHDSLTRPLVKWFCRRIDETL